MVWIECIKVSIFAPLREGGTLKGSKRMRGTDVPSVHTGRKKGIAPEIIFKINFADIKKIPTFAVPSETKKKNKKRLPAQAGDI
ncbi:hypothetical protein [Sphingobacterium wenxiniae]|uniref:hypothetical protein n=1 Tax=Sphingobacterium wenxiniae TaxID=683125 RepID=UPI000B81A026|nr:hypothetical protein [Sphingobacterium wenxiniae]